MTIRSHRPGEWPVFREPNPEGGWQRASFSTTDEGLRVLQAVTSRMARQGYPERDVFAVRLGLEEALVNAVKHGHHSDPSKRVHVRYCVTPTQVLAEVEDQGPGFDPGAVPDPTAPANRGQSSGRGLFLMRSYLTSVRYNPKGNRVTLCKQRSGG